MCLVGWLLALGLVFPAPGQDKLAEARQSYEEGWLGLQNENYPFALEKLEKARSTFAEAGQWAQYLDSGIAQSLALSRMGQSTEALTLAKMLEMEYLPKLATLSLPEAGLGNALGEIYLKNGRNDLAHDYFQKALDLYTTSFPDQHRAIADCYDNLSLVLWNAQHQERALEYAFKALYLREAVPANGEAKMAASYNNIGLIYSQSGDYPKAKAYYLKALAIYQVIYEANHPKIANALNNLGIIEWQQALFSEAIPYFEKALAIYLQKYGPEHPNIAFVYAYLGQVYLGKQDFVKALDFAQQALHIYQKNYAEKHPEVAKTYNLLGNIHLQNKAYKKAQAFFKKRSSPISLPMIPRTLKLRPPSPTIMMPMYCSIPCA
ncbi:MAG: tetratricopeptide repeat protein [Microscillaceae bacterium]|nr:tetratricopeptide repeat protein [Microscillaceae bacterium]